MSGQKSVPRIVHGAFAGSQKAADLRRIRRRTLNHLGIKSVRDLSGEQRLLLDLFCQAYRLIERLDPVTADGNASGNSAAFNAALTRSQKALEAFIASLGTDRQRRDQSAILAELQRYRGGVVTGIAAFFRDVLQTPLWPRWAEVLTEYERQAASELIMACGRRGGKTTTTAGLAVHHAVVPDLSGYLRPGEARYVLGIGPSLDQARIWLRACRDFITGSEQLHGLLLEDTADELTLANRVVIKAMPCSARSIRGLPASMVVMDEAAHFVDSESGPAAAQRVYQALTPSVAQFGPAGRVVILSTPLFKSGLFHDLVRRAESDPDPSVMLVRASSAELNPTLDPAWLERQRQRDPEAFAVEYLAQFSDSISGYLDFAAIQACVSRGVLERPPREGAQYAIGLDPGYTTDRFTAVVACLVGERISVDAVRGWRGTRAEPVQHQAVLAEVGELAERYNGATVHTDQYCAVPVQQGLAALRCRVVYAPWSNDSKRSAFSALKAAINTQAIDLPDHADLLRELASLEIRQTPGGRPRIAAPLGAHDDYCTALAAAVAALSQHVEPASADVAAPPGAYHADRASVLAGPGQLRRRMRGM